MPEDQTERMRRPVTSLELTLDDELDAGVRARWHALQTAGVSSMGASAAVSNRPHVTLLVRPAFGPIDVTTLADALPTGIRLGAPVLFGRGDRRVLALSVVATRDLLALHRDLHRCAGDGEDAPHTTPDEWTPHVTLARQLKVTDLATALAAIEGPPLRGHAVGLRRWDAALARETALLPSARPAPARPR